jgi:hypothetical protein
VRDVHLAACQLCQQHVALDHDRLGRARPAPQAEEGRDRALVHRRLLGEARLLAVVDHGQPEGLRVLQRPAHHARARHRAAVVRDRDAARLAQVPVLRQLLALRAARDGPDRIHAHGAFGARALEDRAGDARGVVDRLGVRHRAHRGEPARRRRPRACRDRLLVLAPGLAQVRVQVDEARAHDAAERVQDRRALGVEPLAHAHDAPVLDAHVRRAVDVVRRVDHAPALHDERSHSEASGAPPSRR